MREDSRPQTAAEKGPDEFELDVDDVVWTLRRILLAYTSFSVVRKLVDDDAFGIYKQNIQAFETGKLSFGVELNERMKSIRMKNLYISSLFKGCDYSRGQMNSLSLFEGWEKLARNV